MAAEDRRDAALHEAFATDTNSGIRIRYLKQYDINTDATSSQHLDTFSISTTELCAVLCEQRLTLTAYLLSKVKAGDWHAVQDAASDIREIEAKLSVLRV
jgi:hypothetical protein